MKTARALLLDSMTRLRAARQLLSDASTSVTEAGLRADLSVKQREGYRNTGERLVKMTFKIEYTLKAIQKLPL